MERETQALGLCGWEPPGSVVTYRTTVVYETRQVPALGGVYDGVLVHAEQIAAADPLLRVPLLSHVRHNLQRHKSEPGNSGHRVRL